MSSDSRFEPQHLDEPAPRKLLLEHRQRLAMTRELCIGFVGGDVEGLPGHRQVACEAESNSSRTTGHVSSVAQTRSARSCRLGVSRRLAGARLAGPVGPLPWARFDHLAHLAQLWLEAEVREDPGGPGRFPRAGLGAGRKIDDEVE